MTSTTTETTKVRNLESSILFLQEQHAETLKHLHDEIRTLQKKNSELTFRLEMGLNVGSPYVCVLEERVRSLTLEADTFKQQLDTTTQEKDRRITLLGKQLRQQENTFREELKGYGSKCRKLQQELTSKSDAIAELQLQLYSANADLAAKRSSNTPLRLLPTPPKEGAPRARRGSRKTVVPIDLKAIPNDHHSSSGVRRDYVLDPTPFLLREGSPIEGPQRFDPLPPINPQERTQSPMLHRPEAEVVELALGSVQRSESWRRAPSPSSNFK